MVLFSVQSSNYSVQIGSSALGTCSQAKEKASQYRCVEARAGELSLHYLPPGWSPKVVFCCDEIGRAPISESNNRLVLFLAQNWRSKCFTCSISTIHPNRAKPLKNTAITSMICLRMVSMFQQAVNTYLQVPILQSSHSITRQAVAKEKYEQVSTSVGVVIGQGETKFQTRLRKYPCGPAKLFIIFSDCFTLGGVQQPYWCYLRRCSVPSISFYTPEKCISGLETNKTSSNFCQSPVYCGEIIL